MHDSNEGVDLGPVRDSRLSTIYASLPNSSWCQHLAVSPQLDQYLELRSKRIYQSLEMRFSNPRYWLTSATYAFCANAPRFDGPRQYPGRALRSPHLHLDAAKQSTLRRRLDLFIYPENEKHTTLQLDTVPAQRCIHSPSTYQRDHYTLINATDSAPAHAT